MAIKQGAPGITQFDDVEDFFAAEEKARVEADARVQPYQAAVKVGDFVVRAACGMIIYGEVLDPCKSEEPEEGLSPEDLEEIRAEMEVERQSWAQPEMKNYRFSRCYSQACPEGELGDFHVSSVLCVIPPVAFKEAQRQGWPMRAEFVKAAANLS